MTEAKEIESVQLDKLNRLLSALSPQNPFYSRKIDKSGLRFPVSDLAEFQRNFPFTTKTEIVDDQAAHPPYGSNLTYPLSAYSRCHETSGTSGTSLSWLDTSDTWLSMLGHWETIYEAASVTPTDKLLFAFSFGPFLGFWTAFEAAAAMGCFCFPGGSLSTIRRLSAIETHRISVICCTPTYALRLGSEAAKTENVDISSVRTIIVAGEPGGNIRETVTQIESMWSGARVVDHHGMTEVGPVSYSRADSPSILRIIESAFIAEIIDPESREPVTPGEEGELVLTTLDRIGSPLLRYRTGDLVRSSAKVEFPGQSPYLLEGGILGRIDDMVVIRGVNIYPAAIENIIRKTSSIAEYQVIISNSRNMMEMEVRIEPETTCTNPENVIQQLTENFRNDLSLRIPVTSVTAGTLPRFEMKARRWVRK